MKIFSMIMAGGGGTRFWPLSRQNMPKQLLNLSGNDAMINETVKRCEPLIPIQNNFIVTHKNQTETMKVVLIEEFLRENILVEPVARNTAACILYAAMHIYEKHGDGVLCVFPSDHYITEGDKFIEVLKNAIAVADSSESVVTLGIKPSFPATGYGYIKRDGKSKFQDAYKLERFVEKPSLDRAKEYVQSGEYYWNSGMFIWKVSVILELFKRFLPRLFKSMEPMQGKFLAQDSKTLLGEIYPKLDSISVDYGIMERLDEAYLIPGDFGWNDVGSWDALGSVFPADEDGNIVKADYLGVDTKECIVYGNKKLITTVGMYNTVIVDTDDAILICAKDKAQDVKYIVDKLKEQGKMELL